VSKYIEENRIGIDFVYDMAISTKEDDFSPLILSEDGGIEEAMFLDIFLIFKYLEVQEIEILPFFRKSFSLIGKHCEDGEILSLFEKKEKIKKNKDSGTIKAMLGLSSDSEINRVLDIVKKEEKVFMAFNQKNLGEIRDSITNHSSEKSEKENMSLSFSLRDTDKKSISPLIKILAGMESEEKMRLPLIGSEGKIEKIKELMVNSGVELKGQGSDKERISTFLSKISSEHMTGELVVSFKEKI